MKNRNGMNKHITTLNSRLSTLLTDNSIPLGLSSGKMGLCIYFYYIGRKYLSKENAKIAEELLDEIFAEIHSIKNIDIEHGLSGIGLSINYLIKNNYVQGNENEILKDIDDEIFKQISSDRSDHDVSILIQILYYIYIRKQSSKKESDILFNELAIHIINTLHSKVELILTERHHMFSFNINTPLPLFLFALSKIYELNIYNYKVKRILNEIIPFILTKYSSLDSKRLHVLWGVSSINQYVKNESLTEYCDLLRSQINVSRLLEEFPNKNIFLKDGISGLCLLILLLNNDEKQKLPIKDFYSATKKRIETSLVWEQISNTSYLKQHIGLTGYNGLIMIMDMIKDAK